MIKHPKLIILAGMLFVGIVIVVILSFNDPAKCNWLPKCTFYLISGIYCPGCGSTRALHALLHGNILYSLRCNILLLPTGFVFLLLLWKTELLLKTWILYAIISVLIGFTVLRNLPWYPFTLLIPPQVR